MLYIRHLFVTLLGLFFQDHIFLILKILSFVLLLISKGNMRHYLRILNQFLQCFECNLLKGGSCIPLTALHFLIDWNVLVPFEGIVLYILIFSCLLWILYFFVRNHQSLLCGVILFFHVLAYLLVMNEYEFLLLLGCLLHQFLLMCKVFRSLLIFHLLHLLLQRQLHIRKKLIELILVHCVFLRNLLLRIV